MAYTLADVNWNKFYKTYGFGDILGWQDKQGASVYDEGAWELSAWTEWDIEDVEKLLDSILVPVTCTFACYNLPDEIKRMIEEHELAPDSKALTAFLKSFNVEPARTVKIDLVYYEGCAADLRESFDGEYAYLDVYVNTQRNSRDLDYDLSGFYFESGNCDVSVSMTAQEIARRQGVDFAVMIDGEEELHKRQIKEQRLKAVSIEEAIANGCGADEED